MNEKNIHEKNIHDPAPVPFAVHESALAFSREIIARQWWVIILLILLLFGTNAGWLWYESQYDKISYTQDGEGLNNVCTGTQGAILYGTESQVQEEALRQNPGSEGS